MWGICFNFCYLKFGANSAFKKIILDLKSCRIAWKSCRIALKSCRIARKSCRIAWKSRRIAWKFCRIASKSWILQEVPCKIESKEICLLLPWKSWEVKSIEYCLNLLTCKEFWAWKYYLCCPLRKVKSLLKAAFSFSKPEKKRPLDRWIAA